MAPPIRQIGDAEPGQITATPNSVLRKLAIRKFRLPGIKGGRRGKR